MKRDFCDWKGCEEAAVKVKVHCDSRFSMSVFVAFAEAAENYSVGALCRTHMRQQLIRMLDELEKGE